MGDLRATADPGTRDRGTDQRGLGAEERLRVLADEVIDDGRSALRERRMFTGKPKPVGGDSGTFFADLVSLNQSSPIDPMSPERAAAIEKRWGFKPPHVSDPELRASALLGFEVVLTVATFIPAVSKPATAVLLLLAVAQGDKSGAVLTVAGFPLGVMGRLGKLSKGLQTLSKGAVKLAKVPATLQEYRTLARVLITNDWRLEHLVRAVRPVTKKGEMLAAQKAARAYSEMLSKTGDVRAASQHAGDVYHAAVGAAGPGKGVDKVLRGGKDILEIKTHYTPILDKFVIEKGNEAVLAYVLKDFVEQGVVRRGLVQHVFIDPKSGKAVSLIVDSLDGKLITELIGP